MNRATVFVPGSIGNVGPGFDVLGLAIGGIGDRVTVELTDGPARIEEISGRDAALLPREPERNTASIAAAAWLRRAGVNKNPIVSICKSLPLAGGMGGSAASSVGGAYAATLAAGAAVDTNEIMAAALEAEEVVAGRHLDNIAPSTLGGLCLVRGVDPVDVISVAAPESWRVALVTPRVRISTRDARGVLPEQWDSASWIQQMANTAALLYAFTIADEDLVSRALDDLYAEPRRAALIPSFHEIKRAALANGAFGCSISGSGPTVFAIASERRVSQCAAAMKNALGGVEGDVHVTSIAREGARRV
ncbi:MAG: homoserine kinase [Thermoanaerobaculia bacterium]